MMTENSLKTLVSKVLRGDHAHTTHNLHPVPGRDPEYAYVEDWLLTIASETPMPKADLAKYLYAQVMWTMTFRALSEREREICADLLSAIQIAI